MDVFSITRYQSVLVWCLQMSSLLVLPTRARAKGSFPWKAIPGQTVPPEFWPWNCSGLQIESCDGPGNEAVPLDPLYFKLSKKENCDWGETSLGSCLAVPVPEHRPGRDFYFLGNSVTRHYAFGLKGLLENISDTQATDAQRREEKRLCVGVVGTNALCKLYAYSGNEISNITFMWKNIISSEGVPDERSDICHDQPTLQDCLRKNFVADPKLRANLNHGAGPQDVLVIGSAAINGTFFNEHGTRGISALHMVAPMFGVSAQHADVDAIVQTLLGSFPGSIIWHSNTHLNLKLNYVEVHRDLNGCYEYIDARVRCAIRRKGGRIQFLNYRPMQEKYLKAFENRKNPTQADKSPYLDAIHHPGALSEAVMRSVLAMLPDIN